MVVFINSTQPERVKLVNSETYPVHERLTSQISERGAIMKTGKCTDKLRKILLTHFYSRNCLLELNVCSTNYMP